MLRIVVLFILVTSIKSAVCVCDTTSVCDLLCCCDPECSAEDKLMFTCNSSSEVADVDYNNCVSQSLFSKMNTEDMFNLLKTGTNYCFSSTTSSKTVTTKIKVEKPLIGSDKELFTFSQTFRNISKLNHTIYKAGDFVYKRNLVTKTNTPLTTPVSFQTSCVRDSVVFQRNTSSTCDVTVTTSTCKAGSPVDSLLFTGLNILKNFKTSPEIVTEIKSECQDDSGGVLECKAPEISLGSCDSVMVGFELVIMYGNDTVADPLIHGIISAQIKMVLKTVVLGSKSPLLSTTRFQSNKQHFPNSIVGNMRYKPGWEVYFKVNNAKTPFIDLISDNSCKFSFTFPTTTILSCLLDIPDSFDFATLTTTLSTSLPTHLARFYNSALGSPEEWLPLTWDLPDTGYTRQSFPSSMQVNIHYRSYGSRVNPEDEISAVTTSISTVNLESLQKMKLFKNKQIIYFSVRFVRQDIDEPPPNRVNILSRAAGSLSGYFASQRDSVPLQLLAVAVAVFLVITLGILVGGQGKHSF